MPEDNDSVHRMTGLARELEASLTAEQRAAAREELSDPNLRDWTYLPGDRPGLAMLELSPDQHAVVLDLLRATESPDAAGRAVGAIEVERVRRTLAAGAPPPAGADRYWLRLLGVPGREPWGWRVNGHHLAVHVVVAGGECSVTPQFVGSEPAVLPDESPWPGRRLLGPEEELALALLDSLEPDRRAEAVASDRAPDDILTGADPVADPTVLPPGLARGDMTPAQQEQLDRIVRLYLSRAPQATAEAAWSAAAEAGLDRLSFVWAGSTDAGVGRYYCVHGPTLIIEYDNTQDGANHAHSVWRDASLDWGEDLLRRHLHGLGSGHGRHRPVQ